LHLAGLEADDIEAVAQEKAQRKQTPTREKADKKKERKKKADTHVSPRLSEIWEFRLLDHLNRNRLRRSECVN
jgi:hypothetical protein